MEDWPTNRDRSVRSRRLGRWDAAALLLPVALVLTALGVLIANHGGAPNLDPGLAPPPYLYHWAQQATLNSATPQQAYAAAMSLTPCLGAASATPGTGNPPLSTTVTWLVATSDYGLAQVQAVCNSPARSFHRFIFELYRDPAGGWRPQGGYLARNWSANSTVTAPAPTWLSLPTDTYDYFDVEQPGIQESPAVSAVDWDAQTRLFVFGHIADQAIRPDSATSVVVEGLPGWMMTENGLVTVTIVRADGTTLFFSGTGTPAEVQTLAAQAFAHVNDALQPLESPTTTPATPAAATRLESESRRTMPMYLALIADTLASHSSSLARDRLALQGGGMHGEVALHMPAIGHWR